MNTSKKIWIILSSVLLVVTGAYIFSGIATAKGGKPKPSPKPSPTVTTAPPTTDFRIITRQEDLPILNVGGNDTVFIEACCGTGAPYTWKLVAGVVPDGMRFLGNELKLTRTTGIFGSPTKAQTVNFTVEARDQAGRATRKAFTLTVAGANPLIINNGTDVLTNGKVGVAYNNGLFPLGGVSPWRWSFVSGQLPPGLRIQASPGRVLGTPTTAGTFTFIVRVDDSSGQFATGQFTITVNP